MIFGYAGLWTYFRSVSLSQQDPTEHLMKKMNVYESVPSIENEKFMLRQLCDEDKSDLLEVYGDEKAAQFFNSDNCNGDDFRYTTAERMKQALDFWKTAYKNGWFVRLAIVDKTANKTIGTIEEFHREANDYFTNCGLLRLDLRSDCERTDVIKDILSLIVPISFDLFGCDKIATKAVSAASERINALNALGFSKSNNALLGHDGTDRKSVV